MGWRRRRRRGTRGRLPKPVSIGKTPTINQMIPIPVGNTTPLYLESAEVEALRLVDFEGLSQAEAGERLGVSRGTVWRLVQSARKKTAQALIEGRSIRLLSTNADDAPPSQQSE